MAFVVLDCGPFDMLCKDRTLLVGRSDMLDGRYTVGWGSLCVVPFIGTLLVVGCIDPPGEGNLLIIVTSEDVSGTPFDGLTEVRVRARRVDVVHRADCSASSSERVLTVDSQEVEFILSTATPNVGRFVTQVSVPEGCVSQVRLITDDMQIVVDMNTIPVRIPSGSQTGIKIVPDDGEPPFPIVADETTAIAVSYDPNEKIILNRGQGALEKPVLRASTIPPEFALGTILDRLVLTFDSDASDLDADVDEAFDECGGTLLTRYPRDLLIVQLRSAGELEDKLECFLDADGVATALPDTLLSVQGPNPFVGTPDDPISDGDLVNLQSIAAPQAWEVTTGSEGVVVAVVDTGFELMHEDIIPNIRINTGELPAGVDIIDVSGDGQITFRDLKDPINADTCSEVAPNFPPIDSCDPLDIVNGDCFLEFRGVDVEVVCAGGYGWQDGLDNDNNGLPDDLIGWDFDENDNLPDPSPFFRDHGTQMAGVVTAVGNNALGVSGVMWNSALVPVRSTLFAVIDDADPPIGDRLVRGGALQALSYAFESGAQVINFSLGSVITRDGSDQDERCKPFGVRDVPPDKFEEGIRALEREWFGRLGSFDGSAVLVVSGQNCGGLFPFSLDLDGDGIFYWPGGFSTVRSDLGLERAHSGMITVTAVDSRGVPGGSSFSIDLPGFAPTGVATITLAAPGTDATLLAASAPSSPPGLVRDTTECGGGCQGASISAAITSGAAGLVFSNNPGLDALTVRQRILDSASQESSLDGAVEGSRFLTVAAAVGP